ncbi:uncharacterized protein [Watersipora subatra]|uniref:uncharacterized protein n=1 Tax=Watersipora subatra TaxID=2589382 RepID=UPI00355C489D
MAEPLPLHPTHRPKTDCDVCVEKGETAQPAVVYCADCSKKYCETHQKLHDYLHVNHVALTITKNFKEHARLEKRNCAEHPNHAYSLGCSVCLRVFCLHCISPGNTCNEGRPHELLNLNELVSKLSSDIKRLSKTVSEKEQKLSALLKKANKDISEFEKNTQELLKKLYQTRDDQINAIRAKYKQLEQELVEARRTTQNQMTAFAEKEVGEALANLSRQRADIENKVKNSHQVDIVRAYNNVQAEMNAVAGGRLPMLSLNSVKSLEVKGTEIPEQQTSNSSPSYPNTVSEVPWQNTTNAVMSRHNGGNMMYIGNQNRGNQRTHCRTFIQPGCGMAEKEQNSAVECVFCWSKKEKIVDPKNLPCGHHACKKCLTGQLEVQKVVWCKNCNKVFDVQIDDLPGYSSDKPDHKCDVCNLKGKKIQQAVMYCCSCSKKYCMRHQEFHDEINDGHVTLTITEYVEQAGRLETRNCEKHNTEAYTFGCGICLTAFCFSCISPTNTCKLGKPHELFNLKELVAKLTGDLDPLKEIITSLETKLSDGYKEAIKQISEFEGKTGEMLEKLHKARDEQIAAIQAKYLELEDELISARVATQEKMTEFAETEVGTMLANLSIQRAEIEARIRNNHQVDIVRAYNDIQAELNAAGARELPALELTNVKTLEVKDMNIL